MAEKTLNHDFCSKFRSEIKARGLKYVVIELLHSASEKVELKKSYLARECRKNAFQGRMIIRFDADSKKYLYDIIDIKKET